MKENYFAGISPEMREILLPLQTQIETLQRQLDNTVAIKDAEIAHLKEVIETYQRMLFGSRSEKTRYLSQMDQLSLFHSEADSENNTRKKTSIVKEHKREMKSGQKRADYITLMVESGKFPVQSVVYDVPEAERFDAQGNPLERLGVEHVRYELEVTPKQYHIKDIQVVSYGSKRNKETEGARSEVKQGEVPPAIIPHWARSMQMRPLDRCCTILPAIRALNWITGHIAVESGSRFRWPVSSTAPAGKGKTRSIFWMDLPAESLRTAAHPTKPLSIWNAEAAGRIREDTGIRLCLQSCDPKGPN